MSDSQGTFARFSTKSFDVEVNQATGTLNLHDRITGKFWGADPWENSAGVLSLESPKGARNDVLLSKAAEVQVQQEGASAIAITFSHLRVNSGETIDAELKTRVSCANSEGYVRAEILSLELPEHWKLLEIEYPCRMASLQTDVDDGYLVIPLLQGTLFPSTVRNWKYQPEFKAIRLVRRPMETVRHNRYQDLWLAFHFHAVLWRGS